MTDGTGSKQKITAIKMFDYNCITSNKHTTLKL